MYNGHYNGRTISPNTKTVMNGWITDLITLQLTSSSMARAFLLFLNCTPKPLTLPLTSSWGGLEQEEGKTTPYPS